MKSLIKLITLILSVSLLPSCGDSHYSENIMKEDLVNYYGKQGNIVKLGEAAGKLPIKELSGFNATYGVGACGDLDGEITVFNGKPYVTKVRSSGLEMDRSADGKAIFAVWTKNKQWHNETLPDTVNNYLDLQRYVKTRATVARINTQTTAFPFLLTGTPKELQWHVNVNRTNGRPITKERFKQSKEYYMMENEAVSIVGFYSERHHGIFIGTFSPAIQDDNIKNAIHIHVVSKDGKLAGHIDDLRFEGNMEISLPK